MPALQPSNDTSEALTVKVARAALEEILLKVSQATPFEDACIIHGLSPAQVLQQKGMKERLRLARAQCTHDLVQMLVNQKGSGWQRITYLLNRINPIRWPSGNDVSIDDMDEAECVRLIKAMIEIGVERGYDLSAEKLGVERMSSFSSSSTRKAPGGSASHTCSIASIPYAGRRAG